MITQYLINGTEWIAITTAGQSGSCWLDEENDGAKGQVDLRIFHSDSGEPESGDTTKGKRVWTPSGNNDVCIISADNSSDIYYAKCRNPDDSGTITVDVI